MATWTDWQYLRFGPCPAISKKLNPFGMEELSFIIVKVGSLEILAMSLQISILNSKTS